MKRKEKSRTSGAPEREEKSKARQGDATERNEREPRGAIWGKRGTGERRSVFCLLSATFIPRGAHILGGAKNNCEGGATPEDQVHNVKDESA